MEELEEAPPLQPKPLSEQEIVAIEKREVGSDCIRCVEWFQIVGIIGFVNIWSTFLDPLNLLPVFAVIQGVQEYMSHSKSQEASHLMI